MPAAVDQKICEMRIMLSVRELEEFKRDFPDIKWTAGDTEIKWNSNDPDEVEMARKAYNAYKSKHPNAKAYRVFKGNNKISNIDIDDFDPNAELIILQDAMKKG